MPAALMRSAILPVLTQLLAGSASEAAPTAVRTGAEEVVQFGSGPSVRIVPGDRDAVVGLVLAVRDVAAAQAAWPRSLAGLHVEFVRDAVVEGEVATTSRSRHGERAERTASR